MYASSFPAGELLGHRMAEHPKFPLNTDHSISAPLRISPHYTIRIAQADPLQTIHLTVMPYEGFIGAQAFRLRKDFGKLKVKVDLIFTISSIVISLILLHNMNSVGLGTLLHLS